MAFALKVADVTELPGLTSEEHRSLEARAQRAVRTVWVYAAGNVVAAALVLVPSVLVDAKAAVGWVTVAAAGVGAGFSVYSVIAHAVWQEELRRFKSSLRLREREQAARSKISSEIGSGELSGELREAIQAKNRSIEWPDTDSRH